MRGSVAEALSSEIQQDDKPGRDAWRDGYVRAARTASGGVRPRNGSREAKHLIFETACVSKSEFPILIIELGHK